MTVFGTESCLMTEEVTLSVMVLLGECTIGPPLPATGCVGYFTWYTSNVFVMFPLITAFINRAPFA